MSAHPMMDADLYRAELLKVYAAAQVLADVPIPEMLAAIGRADSAAFILDPTLYRDNVDKMHEDAEALRSASTLRLVGLKMRGQRP